MCETHELTSELTMKQILKSINIQVPASVIYASIKEVDVSRYTTDLFGGAASTIFTKDIPNQLLAVESSSGLAKLQVEISLRSLGESMTEVTIKFDHKWTNENAVKLLMMAEIATFLALEYGYNTRIQ